MEKFSLFEPVRPNRDLLKREQLDLLHILREKLHLDVTELVPEESTPLCAFVEDLAIVHNGRAFLTIPYRDTDSPRELEVKSLKIALKDYGIEIFTINLNPTAGQMTNGDSTPSPAAPELPLLDGGDVLYTGFEFFVGISQFTNVLGAMQFANVMTDIAVTIVHFPKSELNDPYVQQRKLKDYITVACESLLVVANNPVGHSLLRQIINNSSYDYNTVSLSSDLIANCLFINGYLLYPDIGPTGELGDGAESEYKKLDSLISRIPVPAAEFTRIKTSLTRRVLVFDAPHTHGAKRR
jgi:dimethylargininase